MSNWKIWYNVGIIGETEKAVVCHGWLKDPVICDLLRVKGLKTPGL